MDMITLAMAKDYTNSQRIAYEEKESYTLSASERVSLPFSELIGLEVVDILSDRVLMSTPSSPPSQTGLLFKYGTFEISYGTYNQMLSKPCLLLGDYQQLSYWCPLFFYDENRYQALIYAFEEVTDTMGMGITFAKGWHAVNTSTFVNEPFDPEKYPLVYTLRQIEQGSEENSKEYMKGMFRLAEEITYTIKSENILEEDTYAIVSPWEISSGNIADSILSNAVFSFWFNKSTHEAQTLKSVIITGNKIHTIDPKYLPKSSGLGLPVVELTTPGSLVVGSSVELTEDESKRLTEVTNDGMPFIVVFSLEYEGQVMNMTTIGAIVHTPGGMIQVSIHVGTGFYLLTKQSDSLWTFDQPNT